MVCKQLSVQLSIPSWMHATDVGFTKAFADHSKQPLNVAQALRQSSAESIVMSGKICRFALHTSCEEKDTFLTGFSIYRIRTDLEISIQPFDAAICMPQIASPELAARVTGCDGFPQNRCGSRRGGLLRAAELFAGFVLAISSVLETWHIVCVVRAFESENKIAAPVQPRYS